MQSGITGSAVSDHPARCVVGRFAPRGRNSVPNAAANEILDLIEGQAIHRGRFELDPVRHRFCLDSRDKLGRKVRRQSLNNVE